jgi:hypothetical protein
MSVAHDINWNAFLYAFDEELVDPAALLGVLLILEPAPVGTHKESTLVERLPPACAAHGLVAASHEQGLTGREVVAEVAYLTF